VPTLLPLPDRFWSKVAGRADPAGCWTWVAGKFPKGYGVFRIDGKSKSVHRLSYESMVGPIPAGLSIDHLCRNRACVNPAHLEAVTNRVNVLRGVSYIAACAKKTHCPQGHPYAGENLHVYQGRRYCRACHKVHARAHDARRREARAA